MSFLSWDAQRLTEDVESRCPHGEGDSGEYIRKVSSTSREVQGRELVTEKSIMDGL